MGSDLMGTRRDTEEGQWVKDRSENTNLTVYCLYSLCVSLWLPSKRLVLSLCCSFHPNHFPSTFYPEKEIYRLTESPPSPSPVIGASFSHRNSWQISIFAHGMCSAVRFFSIPFFPGPVWSMISNIWTTPPSLRFHSCSVPLFLVPLFPCEFSFWRQTGED